MKAIARVMRDIATEPATELDVLYESTKERLRALTIERANRIVENWEIAFAPDDRDRELAWEIFELKREFTLIEQRYLSARGELIFIGCHAGEHKKCNRVIKRDKATLTCGCNCHQLQGGVI